MSYFFVFLFFAGHSGFSQTLNIDWEKRVNKTGADVFSNVIEDSDGGYTVVGYTHQSERGDLDFWVVRFSANGTLIDEKTFGTENDDIPSDVSRFSTGECIIVGKSVSDASGDIPLFIKIDSVGNEIWKESPNVESISVKNVITTSDGGFISYGTQKLAVDNEKMWLAKFDGEGELLWEKKFGENGFNQAESMKKLPDEGFVIAGRTLKNNNVPDGDLWMARFDSEGNKMWDKIFESENINVLPECICCGPDNNFLVVGWHGTCMNDINAENPIFDYDLFLSKISSEGDVIWSKNIDSEGSEGGNAIVVRPDGKIIVAGRKETSFLGRVGSWLLLTDQQGIVSEEAVYPFNFGDDQAAEIINSSDGGFVLIGPGIIDSNHGSSDGWIKKFKAF